MQGERHFSRGLPAVHRTAEYMLTSHRHSGQDRTSWGGSRGGVQVSKDPPGPQRGGPGPLFQDEENSIYYLQFYLGVVRNKNIYIYCVNYIKLHQESMKVCFCWRKK